MAAPKYRTAQKLRIPAYWRKALIDVMRGLLDGTIREKQFDMNWWEQAHGQCGTTYCIGGWAEKLAGRRCPAHTKALDRLFYPQTDGCGEAYDATPEQAAVAIKNYLTTGQPKWRRAMGLARSHQ